MIKQRKSVTVSLRCTPEFIKHLDHIASYLALSGRTEALRYVATKGLEEVRHQQSQRDQADLLGSLMGIRTDEPVDEFEEHQQELAYIARQERQENEDARWKETDHAGEDLGDEDEPEPQRFRPSSSMSDPEGRGSSSTPFSVENSHKA